MGGGERRKRFPSFPALQPSPPPARPSEGAVCPATDDLPWSGGFLTPASAMGDALLRRLVDNAGLAFELM